MLRSPHALSHKTHAQINPNNDLRQTAPRHAGGPPAKLSYAKCASPKPNLQLGCLNTTARCTFTAERRPLAWQRCSYSYAERWDNDPHYIIHHKISVKLQSNRVTRILFEMHWYKGSHKMVKFPCWSSKALIKHTKPNMHAIHFSREILQNHIHLYKVSMKSVF